MFHGHASRDGEPGSLQDIKLAYRRALLLHHPDKSTPSQKPECSNPTIDQITIAYKTLTDPVARSEYDRLLSLKSTTGLSAQVSHPGLETVDLDELLYDDARETWYRSCRCGKERAYTITEEELEINTEYGELVTGCQGCSLWLRVTFAVAEDG
ncbi:hypothetical protein N7G274_007008 [Stereocaulon virgatum]|uniref:Diphthamide biosynthesis protein 4 n=1 Tax=Stereocaulon virgatum TaxID=373712 RepID=A0ABR4A3U8_9LECA